MSLTERLEALAALEAAAIPRPWEGGSASGWGHTIIATHRYGIDEPGTVAADATPADAALIAAARNALPELLAVARVAQGALAQGVGNLSAPKYGQRVEAFDVLDDALDALAEKLP